MNVLCNDTVANDLLAGECDASSECESDVGAGSAGDVEAALSGARDAHYHIPVHRCCEGRVRHCRTPHIALLKLLLVVSAIAHFITHRRYENVVHAMSSGAMDGVGIVVGATTNIIVCMAALEFFNVTLAWIGARVDLANLSFQVCGREAGT